MIRNIKEMSYHEIMYEEGDLWTKDLVCSAYDQEYCFMLFNISLKFPEMF